MERAIRYSKKREAILSLIRGTSCHPSAEWMYQRLRPLHPGVVQGQERFDAITTPHSHFVCNCCGAVLDLPDICPDRDLERTVSTQYGFTAERCELTFYGLCPDCADRQNLKEEPLL